MIKTKPALEPRVSEDGYRVLIDPTWPKGMPTGKAAGVDWMKSLYPSRNLQDWMRRNPRKRDGFRDRYLLELAAKDDEVRKIGLRMKERGAITILIPPGEDPWDIYETLAAFLRSVCA